MHKCLQIEEVVQMIVAQLAGSKTGGQWWRDITNVGLTCKGFYEPAMDVSWRDLGDFSVSPLMASDNHCKSFVLAFIPQIDMHVM